MKQHRRSGAAGEFCSTLSCAEVGFLSHAARELPAGFIWEQNEFRSQAAVNTPDSLDFVFLKRCHASATRRLTIFLRTLATVLTSFARDPVLLSS